MDQVEPQPVWRTTKAPSTTVQRVMDVSESLERGRVAVKRP
jgi:hypothetical protein